MYCTNRLAMVVLSVFHFHCVDEFFVFTNFIFTEWRLANIRHPRSLMAVDGFTRSFQSWITSANYSSGTELTNKYLFMLSSTSTWVRIDCILVSLVSKQRIVWIICRRRHKLFETINYWICPPFNLKFVYSVLGGSAEATCNFIFFCWSFWVTMGLTISSVLTRLFGKKQMRILMGKWRGFQLLNHSCFYSLF